MIVAGFQEMNLVPGTRVISRIIPQASLGNDQDVVVQLLDVQCKYGVSISNGLSVVAISVP